MAKFNAKAVERIEWDFREIARADGAGFCGGKGTLPEPTDDQIDAFLAATRDVDRDFDVNKFEDVTDDFHTRARARHTEWMANLGIPADQLDELPPRQFTQFRVWLVGQLSPEAASVV